MSLLFDPLKCTYGQHCNPNWFCIVKLNSTFHFMCFQFSAKDNRTSIGSSWGRMKLNSRAGRSARRARSPIWSRQRGRGGYEGGKLAALQHQVCQAQIGNIVRLTLKDLRPNPTEGAAQGTDPFRSPCRDVSLLRDSRSW